MVRGDMGVCSTQLLFLGNEEECDIDLLLSPFIMPNCIKKKFKNHFQT